MAPVVTTSSTSRTRAPCTLEAARCLTANAPRTFARRLPRPRPTWARVARTRLRAGQAFPQWPFLTMPRTRVIAWLWPRAQRRRQCSGRGTMSSERCNHAPTPDAVAMRAPNAPPACSNPLYLRATSRSFAGPSKRLSACPPASGPGTETTLSQKGKLSAQSQQRRGAHWPSSATWLQEWQYAGNTTLPTSPSTPRTARFSFIPG